MKKVAIFAFMGEQMCFVHALLNALDMHNKGMDVKLIVEGQAVKLIQSLEESQNRLYLKAKKLGLIDCICKACSSAMGVLEYNQECGIRLCDEMNGHPAMSTYTDQDYTIITM